MKKNNINIYRDGIEIGEIHLDLLLIGCDDVICPLESDCDKCIFDDKSIYRIENLRNRFI